MKLVTYVGEAGEAVAGVQVGDEVLALPGYESVLQFLEAGQKGIADAEKLIADKSARRSPLSAVKLLAPIPKPPRVFAIGLNYQEHAVESKMKVQAVPTVFFKLSETVVGPDVDVILPKNSTQVDYEAEMAVVIGKPGYRIAAADADEYIFGYTICNDVSARDVQLATSQWTMGKSFPTFTPIGPCIVSKDEVGDAHDLDISCDVSGERLQDSNTSLLIFRVPQLIEYLSSITPLLAGDIISTGTPPGVGLGRTPQRWLNPEEEMVVTVEKIGSLRNKTVAE
jgi:2-keto-4-pentenoate hydratase/2-oxohepta-3-ene-1,7-dioic acid hydratase in catechol pathway